MTTYVRLVGAILLLLTPALAQNFEPCTLTTGKNSSSIVCEGAVGWVSTDAGVLSLSDTVQSQNTTERLGITLQDITFTGESFADAVEAVLKAGNNKVLDVTLTNCTMERQVAYLGGDSVRIPAGASILLTLDGCRFIRNQILATFAFGSNGDFNLATALNSTTLSNNQLISLGAGLVRGLGAANLGLNDATVDDNQVFSLGALAISGAGSAAPALLGSSVSGNMLLAQGLAALGGTGSYSAKEDGGSEVAGNSVEGMGLFVKEQLLVKAVVGIIARLSFNDPSLNMTQLFGDMQQAICQIMPDDYKERGLGAIGDIAQLVREALCGKEGGTPPNLAGLGPIFDQFWQALQTTDGLSLSNLLDRLGNPQSLLPLALPLLSVFQSLGTSSVLSPEVMQPLLNLVLQLLAPL